MSDAPTKAFRNFLWHVTVDPLSRTLTDVQLLHQFAKYHKEEAFVALIQRHGPHVWRVCRHALRTTHDAEDAFQTTFLVFAHKAPTILKGKSVASWLHGVAYRIALRIRQSSARRVEYERQATTTAAHLPADLALQELQQALDEEVERLPVKYRAPFILCCLEGRSRQEAADELGWKDGTVSSRIAKARLMLERRLAHRGIALSAALCVFVVARGAASAVVPATLASATARAALFVTTGQGSRIVPARVLALTNRIVFPMLITRWKIMSPLILLLALAGGGGLIANLTPVAEPSSHVTRSAVRAPKEPPKTAPKETDLLTAAAEEAKGIDNLMYKVWILLNIAELQARLKDKDASVKTFDEAVEVAKKVKGFEREHRLMDVAAARARAGDVKGAKKTAELIDFSVITRDQPLSKIAIAQARAGDHQGAEDTITSVSTDPWRGEALRELVEAHVKAGRLKEAAKTAESITDDFSRVRAFLSLTRAHRMTKHNKTAAIFLEDAKRIVETIEENDQSDTRAVANCVLAESLAEMGNVKEAGELCSVIKKPLWKASGLRGVAAAQARTGDFKGAEEIAARIEDESTKEEAVKEVVIAQLSRGDLMGALKRVETLNRPYWRAEALSEIAKAQAKAGDNAGSRKTFDKAFASAADVQESEGQFGNAANACYAHIVRAMAEVGLGNEAARWAAEQTDTYRKAQTLLNVAEGLMARKEIEKGTNEKK